MLSYTHGNSPVFDDNLLLVLFVDFSKFIHLLRSLRLVGVTGKGGLCAFKPTSAVRNST
ncbi:MAG: hypothetical protein ACR2LR_01355 [Hassallia sp.]